MKYLASRILGEGASHLFEGKRREHSQALYQGAGLGLLFTGDKAAEGLLGTQASERSLSRNCLGDGSLSIKNAACGHVGQRPTGVRFPPGKGSGGSLGAGHPPASLLRSSWSSALRELFPSSQEHHS